MNNDACSLSIRVQTTINHISICFYHNIIVKKVFFFQKRRELKTALRDRLTRAARYGSLSSLSLDAFTETAGDQSAFFPIIKKINLPVNSLLIAILSLHRQESLPVSTGLRKLVTFFKSLGEPQKWPTGLKNSRIFPVRKRAMGSCPGPL